MLPGDSWTMFSNPIRCWSCRFSIRSLTIHLSCMTRLISAPTQLPNMFAGDRCFAIFVPQIGPGDGPEATSNPNRPMVTKPLVHQNHAHGLFDIFDVLPWGKNHLWRLGFSHLQQLCGWDLKNTGAKSPVVHLAIEHRSYAYEIRSNRFHPKAATFT